MILKWKKENIIRGWSVIGPQDFNINFPSCATNCRKSWFWEKFFSFYFEVGVVLVRKSEIMEKFNRVPKIKNYSRCQNIQLIAIEHLPCSRSYARQVGIVKWLSLASDPYNLMRRELIKIQSKWHWSSEKESEFSLRGRYERGQG